ncbi:hypothetical protein WR25_16534 isoform J [Diploscapter pachys]|uniref:FHA domain-containing protein n=2 Tax=Diploscapter pachys TaxID=2018661 RepID=A0A2A2JTN8_9BILA|nr:hypothetical protein WR25_16534 isoform B [Diploscapter pachys]PAV65041.1 hypothetical protein WR25_16534 isoform J [Diploscapter pachys]
MIFSSQMIISEMADLDHSSEASFKAPALPPGFAVNLEEDGKEEKEQFQPMTVDVPEENPKSDRMSIAAPVLHYTPPTWACDPPAESGYKLEIVKNGTIVDTINLETRKHGTFVLIGRLPNCDLMLEHPSMSRYHAVLQYGEDLMAKNGKGWHLYDMGSTHGTKINKKKVPPKQYLRIRVGYVMQFGGSSRVVSLIGPPEDKEDEWDVSPTEMKQKVHQKTLEAKLAAAARKELAEEEKREEIRKKEQQEADEGISWGMNYGDDDDKLITPLELDSHLMEDREQYYMQDPKKALTKFFEREGFDMNFEYREQGMGHTHKWVCTLELPIEIDGVERSTTAQAMVTTSKKDAQVQCALEACRILDAYGILRRSNTRARLKRKTLQDNDFYDEDDDLYLDRTGELEKRRERRMQWAQGGGKTQTKIETYESLCKELEDTRKEVEEIQKQLDELSTKKVDAKATGDELDDYVKQLEGGAVKGDDLKTKIQKSTLRQRLVKATHEAQKLEKLVMIARPNKLPEAKPTTSQGAGGVKTEADKQAFLRKIAMAGRVKKDGAPVEEKKEKAPAPAPKSSNFEEPIIEKSDTADFKPEVESDEEETPEPSTSKKKDEVVKAQEKGKPENPKPKPEKSRDSDEPRKKIDLSKYLKDDEDEKKPEQEMEVEQEKSVRFTKS